MRNPSIVESEHWHCENCGHRGELNVHGRCEACQSEQVFADRFPVTARHLRAGESRMAAQAHGRRD